MKKYIIITWVTFAILLNSCTNSQSQGAKTNLLAIEFADKIKSLPTAPILDVRTPEEFSKGHLPNAQNIDWRSNSFGNQIASLDKSKPVFVYCLSGGRSASAANQMRANGFKEVYELDGGIMKWRGANFSETTDNSSTSTGMNKQQFEALLNSEKLILVDFYADWCAPCQKMKPYLEEITNEMASTVTVIRVNADDNQALCKELKIDALPVLQIYKNKNLAWTNVGFIDKAGVVKQLQ
jgi:thioredoxin 1